MLMLDADNSVARMCTDNKTSDNVQWECEHRNLSNGATVNAPDSATQRINYISRDVIASMTMIFKGVIGDQLNVMAKVSSCT